MKRIIAVLVFLASIFALYSCTFSRIITPTESESSFDGVYIVIDSLEGDGKEEKLNVTWHNETDFDIVFGYRYMIEYNDDGNWKSAMIRDFAVIEIACVVHSGSTASMSYRTEYFSLNKEGRYRLVVDFYVHNSEVDSTSGTSYAYFTVTK